MTRRSYPLSLLACLAGAGLALYAASRTWSLHVTPRPGMTDVRAARTGADVEPWLIGLAVVALAGTGALLATHGRTRRALGVLLALTGAGIAAGAIIGRTGLDVGAAGSGGTLWPVACALGGAIITLGGLAAARHGHRWPRMSARYERRPTPPVETQPGGRSGPLATAGPERGASTPTARPATTGPATAGPGPGPGPATAGPATAGPATAGPATEPVDPRTVWDALDRGDDPTTG